MVDVSELTAGLTPTARVLKKSNEIKTTKDSIGRTISYKTLRPSEQVDLVTLIGSERAFNQITFSMCAAAFRATKIDDVIIFPPETYEDLKNTMDLLDDEGLSALYAAFRNPSDKKSEEKTDSKKKEKAA